MKRILFLDEIRQRLEDPIIVESTDILNDIIERNMDLEDPPDLTLDIRNLSRNALTSLLKFIEEYKSTIIVIANDSPISKPILSRFSEVIKNPIVDENITDIRYLQVMRGGMFLSNQMKEKILNFLDIKYKQTEVSEVDELYDYGSEYDSEYDSE